MHVLFDIRKLDLRGSAMWLGLRPIYSIALLELELTSAKAPGDYAITNRQTAERAALSFGFECGRSP